MYIYSSVSIPLLYWGFILQNPVSTARAHFRNIKGLQSFTFNLAFLGSGLLKSLKITNVCVAGGSSSLWDCMASTGMAYAASVQPAIQCVWSGMVWRKQLIKGVALSLPLHSSDVSFTTLREEGWILQLIPSYVFLTSYCCHCSLTLTWMLLHTTFRQKLWTTGLLRLLPILFPHAIPCTPETTSPITDKDFMQTYSLLVFSFVIAFSLRTRYQHQIMVWSQVALVSGLIVENGTYCMVVAGERVWLSRKQRLPKNETMWPKESWYCRFQMLYNLKSIKLIIASYLC